MRPTATAAERLRALRVTALETAEPAARAAAERGSLVAAWGLLAVLLAGNEDELGMVSRLLQDLQLGGTPPSRGLLLLGLVIARQLFGDQDEAQQAAARVFQEADAAAASQGEVALELGAARLVLAGAAWADPGGRATTRLARGEQSLAAGEPAAACAAATLALAEAFGVVGAEIAGGPGWAQAFEAAVVLAERLGTD